MRLLSCLAKRPLFKALFFDIYCPDPELLPELRLSGKISLKMSLDKPLFSLRSILKLCKVIL